MMKILRQIGGLPFIISTFVAIISFVSHIIREISIKKWERKQEEKHLILSQKFAHNENLLSKTISSLLHITHGSNEMRLSGYQNLWNIMLRIKNDIPSYVTEAYSIYTKQEFADIPIKESSQHQNKLSVEACLVSLGTLTREAEEYRLLVSIEAWNIYWTYQLFIGRLVTLYLAGLRNERLIHFLDDQYTKNILEKMIETNTLSNLIDFDVFAFHNIIAFLEMNFIEQFSNTLSGFSFTKETMNKALEITKQINNINEVKK